MIVFDRYRPVETFWELGLPFLKKEKMFFDIENEELGLCLNEEKINKQNSAYYMANFAVIIFFLFIILGLIYRKPKMERKKRINELDEELEYSKSLS